MHLVNYPHLFSIEVSMLGIIFHLILNLVTLLNSFKSALKLSIYLLF